jgi:hypothetical protein
MPQIWAACSSGTEPGSDPDTQLSQDEYRCCRPQPSFRQCDPIAFWWRRMIPVTNMRVLRESGSVARQESNNPWYWVWILVDCLNYQELCSARGRHAAPSSDPAGS